MSVFNALDVRGPNLVCSAATQRQRMRWGWFSKSKRHHHLQNDGNWNDSSYNERLRHVDVQIGTSPQLRFYRVFYLQRQCHEIGSWHEWVRRKRCVDEAHTSSWCIIISHEDADDCWAFYWFTFSWNLIFCVRGCFLFPHFRACDVFFHFS